MTSADDLFGIAQDDASKAVAAEQGAQVRVLQTPCILWQHALNDQGYGVVWYEGRSQYAHRVAYVIAYGPFPEGTEADHLCRVRRCWNPEHIEAVTGAVNRERAGAAKTRCINDHEYTEANTFRRRGTGARGCRTCRALQAAASRARSLTNV
jgi:hypothetical protein